mgnify:CR=1 FL=1
MKTNVKVYSQRGGRVLWLTHKDGIEALGFEPGSRFNVEYGDKLVITAVEGGDRKVANKSGKPVIAIVGKKITGHFSWEEDGKIESIPATFKDGEITIG